MINDDHDSIFEAITGRLATTAVWRRSMVSKFPDDSRNLSAAERLETLADSDSREVLPQTWQHLDFDNPKFNQILSDCGRAVGFRTKPKSIDAFVLQLAGQLAALPVGAK